MTSQPNTGNSIQNVFFSKDIIGSINNEIIVYISMHGTYNIY